MRFLILISCALMLFYSADAKEHSLLIDSVVTESNSTNRIRQTPYKLSVKLDDNAFHSGDSIILNVEVENKSLIDIFIIQNYKAMASLIFLTLKSGINFIIF